MARQLEMPASSLCIDYAARAANDGWQATAAQRLDIDALRQLARRAAPGGYRTGCGCSHFFSRLTDETQGLVWQGTRSGYGRPRSAGAIVLALKPLFLALNLAPQ